MPSIIGSIVYTIDALSSHNYVDCDLILSGVREQTYVISYVNMRDVISENRDPITTWIAI